MALFDVLNPIILRSEPRPKGSQVDMTEKEAADLVKSGHLLPIKKGKGAAPAAGTQTTGDQASEDQAPGEPAGSDQTGGDQAGDQAGN